MSNAYVAYYIVYVCLPCMKIKLKPFFLSPEYSDVRSYCFMFSHCIQILI